MNLTRIKEDGFDAELEERLNEAGLCGSTGGPVGRTFCFGRLRDDLRYEIISGIVQAVTIPNDDELHLHVSSPTFWGKKLVALVYSNDQFCALLDSNGLPASPADMFEGELVLL